MSLDGLHILDARQDIETGNTRGVTRRVSEADGVMRNRGYGPASILFPWVSHWQYLDV